MYLAEHWTGKGMGGRVSFVKCDFCNDVAIYKTDKGFDIAALLQYADGCDPAWRMLRWKDSERILIPLCFNSHWVLLVVNHDPNVREILIMDSDHSVDRDMRNVKAATKTIERAISHILAYLNIWDKKLKFKLRRDTEFPQQRLS